MLALKSTAHIYMKKLLSHMLLCIFAGACITPHILIAMDNCKPGNRDTTISINEEHQPLLDQQENVSNQQQEKRELDTTRGGDPKRAGPLLPDDPNRSCAATCALLVTVNVLVGTLNLVNHYCPKNYSACQSMQPAILPLNIALFTTDILTVVGLLGKLLANRSNAASANTPVTATTLVNQTNTTASRPSGSAQANADFMI